MIMTAKQQNSEAAKYRIESFLNGTAQELNNLSRREAILMAQGFIEAAELAGLISLEESSAYMAQARATIGAELPRVEIDSLLAILRNWIGGDGDTLDDDEFELARRIGVARKALSDMIPPGAGTEVTRP